MSTAEIARTITTYGGEPTPLHRWAIVEGGQIVSALWVSIETGEIMNVETDAARQGEGLASRLYAQAATEIEILHAPESHRTFEGHRFAASVGGPSITCQHGCCEE
jgi:hypothetical protein